MPPISCGARAGRSRCMRARLQRADSVLVVRRARRVRAIVEATRHDDRARQGTRRAESTARGRNFGRGDPLLRLRRLSDEVVRRNRCRRWWRSSALQPEFVLTHSSRDPYNRDHREANRAHAADARVCAGSGLSRRRQEARRAAGVHLRAAPARAVRVQAAGAARHHSGV